MTAVIILLFILITSLSVNNANEQQTIGYTPIYRFMQISMDFTILNTPSRVLTIDEFLSISITSNNTFEIQIDSISIMHPFIIRSHIPYTLNITLNPSNNHYSLYSISATNSTIYPFSHDLSSSLFTSIPHPISIDSYNIELLNLVITTENLSTSLPLQPSSTPYTLH